MLYQTYSFGCEFVDNSNLFVAKWFLVLIWLQQVDVLEAQYSQLVEKINSTRDFESIRLAHDHFITAMMAQSFLLMKPVKPVY